MNMTAYITSDPARQAELVEQRTALQAQGATPAQLAAIERQMPPLLFSESGALADLESEIRAVIAAWEEELRAWTDEARYDPTSAIADFGPAIIAAQMQAAHALRLQRAWERIAAAEGRSLANFRRAYTEAVEQSAARLAEERLIDRSAWRAAIQRCQRRVLTSAARVDPVLRQLERYEVEAARLPHADSAPSSFGN